MKVSEIAKKINKAWNSDVLTPGSIIPECKRFSMGTMSSDYSLYGGLPEGKLIVYAGPSQSGKSLVSFVAMAQYLEAHPDRTCVYVDAEDTLVGQREFFEQMVNLDPTKYMRYDCSGKAAEEIFDDIISFQEADDIGLIIIDSAPMLISKADIDSPMIKDNGQRSSIAKPLGRFCKFMIPSLSKKGNSLIIINHTRVAGVMYNGAKIYSEPCGYSLDYYPTLKVRFATKKFTEGDKLDATQASEKTDGFVSTFSVTKNRLGPTNRNGAKIVFRYNGGVDTLTDLVEIITKYNIARLDGKTWYLENPITGEPYMNEETGEVLKFVGKPKMVAYIKEHPEFKAEYEKAVSAYINKTNSNISLVDEEDMKEILDMEKSVEENFDDNEKAEVEEANSSVRTSNNDETSVDDIDDTSDEETINEFGGFDE